MLNILTRTSNRPEEFDRLYKSIKNQKNNTLSYKHIVCYENESDLHYLKKYNDLEIFRVKRREIYDKYKDKYHLNNDNPNCFLHNLYCNELMGKVIDGFIIFIDDDDFIYNDNVFYEIEQILNDVDEDTLIMVQMVHPNGRLIPHRSRIHKFEIIQGDIGTPCVIFNKKYVSDKIYWNGWRASDYHFIKKLNDVIPNKKSYELPVVKVVNIGNNYEHKNEEL